MKTVPIGKYKGHPIEVMAEDKQYVEWISSQAWFREKFASLHQMLMQMQVSSDTPEHNAMQARFLDWHYALAATFAIQKTDWMNEEAFVVKNGAVIERVMRRRDWKFGYPDVTYSARRCHLNPAKFEYESADVFLEMDPIYASTPFDEANYPSEGYTARSILEAEGFQYRSAYGYLRIELKPSIGDDYPSVLRQCIASNCNVVVVGRYTGAGAPFDSVVEIFKRSGIRMITEIDIQDWLEIAGKYSDTN